MNAIEALDAALAAQRDIAHQLTLGLPALEQRYREAIDAFAPPNRLFERRRIIAELPNPRELAFVIGCLSEGENEAALILEIAADALAERPQAAIDHLIDEAWYYLRTSIDPEWQLDDGPPSVGATLLYLAQVLDAHIARLRATLIDTSSRTELGSAAQHRLRALRRAFLSAAPMR